MFVHEGGKIGADPGFNMPKPLFPADVPPLNLEKPNYNLHVR